MPQADYFVDTTGGSDAFAGTSWAAAKATIGAGLALVTTVGKTVAVAPGIYNEAVTDPGAAGSSGNQNILVGDTQEEYTDGGAATHGRGPGYVMLTRLSHTSQYPLLWAANHNYWRIQRIAAFARDYDAMRINTAPADFEMMDCFAYGGWSGIHIGGGTGASDSTRLYRNFGIGKARAGITLGRSVGSFDSTPKIEVWNSIGIGGGRCDVNGMGPSGFCVNGGGSSSYSYIKYVGCAGFGLTNYTGANNNPAGFRGRNSTYSKADFTRCYAHGYSGWGGYTGSSWTDCRYTKHPSGTSQGGTEIAYPQFIFQIPRLIGFGSPVHLPDPPVDWFRWSVRRCTVRLQRLAVR
jgi:hypothetical protein